MAAAIEQHDERNSGLQGDGRGAVELGATEVPRAAAIDGKVLRYDDNGTAIDLARS